MKEIEKSRIARLNELHEDICNDMRSAFDKALESGTILCEIKEVKKHGEWLPWVEKNLNYSDRTARRYMKVAVNRELLKTDSVSDLTSAYKVLSIVEDDYSGDNDPVTIEEEEEHRRIKHQKTLDEKYGGSEELYQEERKIDNKIFAPVYSNFDKARKENESVDEYLKRKQVAYDDTHKRQKERWAEVRKKDTEHGIEILKKRFPFYTVTDEGVHFKCEACGKVHDEMEPEKGISGLICEACVSLRKLQEKFPGNKISKDKDGRFKIHFVCETCNKKYWGREYSYSGFHSFLFCSEYCKYCSTLKNSPKWNREEWEKIQKWNKQRESYWSGWSDWQEAFTGEYKPQAEKDFKLGNAQDDANQDALFGALVDYFNDFDNPNRRLNAIHNVVQKLRSVANECQVEIAAAAEPEEIKQIE